MATDNQYKEFGKYKFNRIETIDGIKYHLDNGGWILLRASGTEPLLRVYAEGNSKDSVPEARSSIQPPLSRWYLIPSMVSMRLNLYLPNSLY